MKTFEHGGNIYNSDGHADNWLDFSANINPFGMSETVKAAIIQNLDGLVHYPDPTAFELKSAISKRYEVSAENIIALNGAAEFFYLFFNVARPPKVLIVAPSFSDYQRAAMAANCEIKFFFTSENDNFNVDFEKLMDVVSAEKINCVVLANPNNPTGNVLSVSDIDQIQSAVDYLLIDESFIDFLGDEFSIRRLVRDYKNLIVVQSLTKFFAIPGLRLGFAIADKALIERLECSKDVWNVNFLAQKAGVVALNDDNYINKTRQWILGEKKYAVARLREIDNIKIFEPTVNFILMKFAGEEIAAAVIEEFRRQKILLRSCANFRGLDGRFIRMAIRSRSENDGVINLLERLVGEN